MAEPRNGATGVDLFARGFSSHAEQRPCEPLIRISVNIGHTSNEIGHRGHNEVSRQVGIPTGMAGCR